MDEAFKLFADKLYQEVDGIYIVFMGKIDIISPVYKKGTCVFQLNMFDQFGDSTLLRHPSYEYLGDMYASPSALKTDHNNPFM